MLVGLLSACGSDGDDETPASSQGGSAGAGGGPSSQGGSGPVVPTDRTDPSSFGKLGASAGGGGSGGGFPGAGGGFPGAGQGGQGGASGQGGAGQGGTSAGGGAGSSAGDAGKGGGGGAPLMTCQDAKFTINPANPQAGVPFDVAFHDKTGWPYVYLDATCPDGSKHSIPVPPDGVSKQGDTFSWTWPQVPACGPGSVTVSFVHDRTGGQPGKAAGTCSFDVHL